MNESAHDQTNNQTDGTKKFNIQTDKKINNNNIQVQCPQMQKNYNNRH